MKAVAVRAQQTLNVCCVTDILLKAVGWKVYLKCRPDWTLCSPWKMTFHKKPGCLWHVQSCWSGHSYSRWQHRTALWQVWSLISKRRQDINTTKIKKYTFCTNEYRTTLWVTFDFGFWPFSLHSSASSSSDTASSSMVLLLEKIASSLFSRFPLIRNFPFSSCTDPHTNFAFRFCCEIKNTYKSWAIIWQMKCGRAQGKHFLGLVCNDEEHVLAVTAVHALQTCFYSLHPLTVVRGHSSY